MQASSSEDHAGILMAAGYGAHMFGCDVQQAYVKTRDTIEALEAHPFFLRFLNSGA